jgi:PEP-CTERM motif
MPKISSGLAIYTAVIGAFTVSTAVSAATPEEQLTGVFSDPVYVGYIFNNPGVGQKTYADYSAAAPATTFISPDGSTIQWGTNTAPPDVGTPYSTLTFSGDFVPNTDQAAPIQLGMITYTNGTSNGPSLIFGATLTFYLGGVDLGSDQLIVTTTTNQYSGLDLTGSEAQLDADYINICGPGSNICGKAVQAFENTEGTGGVPFSTPVTAGLNGTYTVDPGITLTSVDYQSGDGVVGSRAAEGAVPEPSTWVMLLLGFAGLGYAGWRARRIEPLTA